MIGEHYPFLDKTYIPVSDTLFFAFLSVGKKAIIPKAVAYTPIEKAGTKYYNFGFGDMIADPATGTFIIDDKADSNNGDMKMVFYTVASTLTDFFKRYPEAVVHVAGSTRQRMDVYEALIVRHWREIESSYHVRGYKDNRLYLFRSNTRYDYILISRAEALTL